MEFRVIGIGQTVRQASVWGTCLWYWRYGFCDLVWVDFEDFSDKFDVWMMANGTTTGKPLFFSIFSCTSSTMKKQPTTA